MYPFSSGSSDLIYSIDVIAKASNSKHEQISIGKSIVKYGLDGTVVEVRENKISLYPPHLQDENFNLFDKYKTLMFINFQRYV